ncbi:triose-phosphate isomerase [Hugenholtzia roseola]|uniref:triose-phosphate isomerase n=1 Tax=Hugenholtzia roseola TaxID=1002 RepID=UPI00047C6737|nr:triose-phosphate isomerase [Hugenholtzia roseola]
MRPQIVAGNWKMNLSQSQAQALTSEIVGMRRDELHQAVELILIPPFVHLKSVGGLFEHTPNLHLGSQNVAAYEAGAYTGEISAQMLQDYQVEYVIIGHSERRGYFAENADILVQKVNIALKNGLRPIFCCGESLEMREKGDYLAFLKNQISEGLFHLSAQEFEKIVIAYEPIWAIGTGRTAEVAQAQEVHQALRQHVAAQYGQNLAAQIPILYGGSVNAKNAAELFAAPDIDGGLVGGASLKSREFIEIAKSFPKADVL